MRSLATSASQFVKLITYECSLLREETIFRQPDTSWHANPRRYQTGIPSYKKCSRWSQTGQPLCLHRHAQTTVGDSWRLKWQLTVFRSTSFVTTRWSAKIDCSKFFHLLTCRLTAWLENTDTSWRHVNRRLSHKAKLKRQLRKFKRNSLSRLTSAVRRLKRPELVRLTPYNDPIQVDVKLITGFTRDVDHGVIGCGGRIEIGVDNINWWTVNGWNVTNAHRKTTWRHNPKTFTVINFSRYLF